MTLLFITASGTVETGFAVDGILWFTDLTLPDPYHVLPIITGLGFFTTIQVLYNIQKFLAQRQFEPVCFVKNKKLRY